SGHHAFGLRERSQEFRDIDAFDLRVGAVSQIRSTEIQGKVPRDAAAVAFQIQIVKEGLLGKEAELGLQLGDGEWAKLRCVYLDGSLRHRRPGWVCGVDS